MTEADRQRLSKIESRLNAATHGPWVLDENLGAIVNDDMLNAWRANGYPSGERDAIFVLEAVHCNDGTSVLDSTKENAEFILQATADIAWLIAQIKAKQ